MQLQPPPQPPCHLLQQPQQLIIQSQKLFQLQRISFFGLLLDNAGQFTDDSAGFGYGFVGGVGLLLSDLGLGLGWTMAVKRSIYVLARTTTSVSDYETKKKGHQDIYIYILKTSTHLLPLIQPNRFPKFTLLNHPSHPFRPPTHTTGHRSPSTSAAAPPFEARSASSVFLTSIRNLSTHPKKNPININPHSPKTKQPTSQTPYPQMPTSKHLITQFAFNPPH